MRRVSGHGERRRKGCVDQHTLLASLPQMSGRMEGIPKAAGTLCQLSDVPIAAAEIDKARTLLLTEQLKSRETVDGRATALGDAWLLTGRAGHANDELPALLAVTAADVQRVVREVLLQGHRTTLEYRPAGSDVPHKDRR